MINTFIIVSLLIVIVFVVVRLRDPQQPKDADGGGD